MRRGGSSAVVGRLGTRGSYPLAPIDRGRTKSENIQVPPTPSAHPSPVRGAPGPGADYVELRCRSAFSFLEGASNPEDLIDRAAELGHPALALADRGGLYGAPRFHGAARAAGVRALVGAEVDLTDDPAGARVLLLVESQHGYRNLSRLLTKGHERTGKAAQPPRSEPKASEGKPLQGKEACLVTWDEIEEHAAGLVAILRGDATLAQGSLDRTRACFGRGSLWVDVSRHLDAAAERAARRAVALAEAARVPIAASNDVRFARPEGRAVLDALACLRHRTSLDRAGRRLDRNAERCLLPREEMARRFADRPGWIRATREVAERCAFGLSDLGYRFPEFPVPPGETQARLLRRLTLAGARERYGHPLQARPRAQLERELALIEKLELCGYFLIVHDIA